MALQSGNHYLVMDRDLTQDKISRLLIQGLAKYTKNIQGRYLGIVTEFPRFVLLLLFQNHFVLFWELGKPNFKES